MLLLTDALAPIQAQNDDYEEGEEEEGEEEGEEEDDVVLEVRRSQAGSSTATGNLCPLLGNLCPPAHIAKRLHTAGACTHCHEPVQQQQ
jgi:hypothetical protein